MPNLSAPVEINVIQDKVNSCDEKCKFTYSYPTSNLLYKTNNFYLSFKPAGNEYDGSVSFHRSYYNLEEIRIYRPALHKFNGKTTADGEIHIIHTNSFGAGQFIVCIPIKTSSDGNSSLNNLLREVARLGNISYRRHLSLANFSLNNLIQSRNYYYYIGTNMSYSDRSVSYIVFDSAHSIKVKKDVWEKVTQYFKKHEITSKTNNNIFYSKNKPIYKKLEGSDIYIDCQPVDSDGTLLVAKEKSYNLDNYVASIYNIVDGFDSEVATMIQLFLGAIVMIILIYIMQKLYDFVSRSDSKITNQTTSSSLNSSNT